MSTMISNRLRNFLEEQRIPYHVIHHRRDYTAQGAAADTHTPGREFAKSVVLSVDGVHAMAVLPAHCRVDVEKLRRALGARDVQLVSEDDIQRLCPDCEVGAEPPLGNLYGLPVYLDRQMTADEQITFNAGTHEDAVRIRMNDFVRTVQPRVMDLCA
jgi:Ala-tRNA(Pro) deacylase